jgi:hypothetical protein
MSGIEILTAVATGLQFAQQIQQGQQQSAMAKYNADVSKAEADSEKQSAAYEASQYQERARKLIATQRASAAASGLGLEGSVFDVMDQTASQATYDSLLIRHAGDVNAAKAMSHARLDRLEGNLRSGDAYYGAGATLLTGGSKLYDLYSASKPKTSAAP